MPIVEGEASPLWLPSTEVSGRKSMVPLLGRCVQQAGHVGLVLLDRGLRTLEQLGARVAVSGTVRDEDLPALQGPLKPLRLPDTDRCRPVTTEVCFNHTFTYRLLQV